MGGVRGVGRQRLLVVHWRGQLGRLVVTAAGAGGWGWQGDGSRIGTRINILYV